MKKLIYIIIPLLLNCSCDADDEVYTDVPIAIEKPSNFPDLTYNFQTNPITQKGFELGKKIFYDARLSSDGVVSCGFCHIQEDAFTHHGHSFSHGVADNIGTRNTPPIQNMAYQTTFMWDGSVSHLDLLSVVPITSEIEMNGNLGKIVTMMKNDGEYKKLFAIAFPGKPIDTEHFLKALGQFMVMLSSSNSKFDKWRRNENAATFSQQEQEGYAIFNQKCSSCHATDIFTDNSFRNNGLPVDPAIKDVGRYRVTSNNADKYKFKVPSLRNIEKTAPYMHDGRFYTLDAVLDHYSSGVINSASLDQGLNNNGKLGISLTNVEKQKLIAFLKTLTDNQFLTDKRFSEF